MTAAARDLLVATTNVGKLREIRAVLQHAPVTLASLADVPPLPAPEETGTTFEANAALKARYYAAATGRRVVAEDSGLVIDALGGAPGVHSARFVRPDASYEERFAEIWRRLAGVPDEARTARFVCALSVVDAGAVVFEARGAVDGRIAAEAAGSDGFGYDPVFYYPPFGCTLAEVGARKGEVSHRAAAFGQLAAWLSTRG